MSAIVLPSKLWELAELGIDALAKIEAKPNLYQVEMTHWHLPSIEHERCLVCFAGAVMATEFRLSPLEFSAPTYFKSPNRGRLLALDSLRVGCVADAAYRAGLGGAEHLRAQQLDRNMPVYAIGAPRFRSAMERLAAELRAASL